MLYSVMSDPLPDTRIQEETAISTRNPSTNGMSPQTDVPRRQITLFVGTLFGAFAGAPIAAVIATICAWLADNADYAGQTALLAMPFGMLLGGVVGFIERTRNSDIVEPSIATWVGVLLGLVPTLASFLGALGIAGGAFSLLVSVGIIFIGPTIGLLVGGALDRAFFEVRSGMWRNACIRIIATLALCACIIPVLDWISTPDAEAVERDAKVAFRDRLSIKEPDPLKRRIRNVTLTHIGNRVFAGEIHTGPTNNLQVWDVRVRHNGGIVQMEAVPRAK
ncbi:MAG: hypothetical protein EXS16_12855 [Gemmataceae bacterium]|nr:hypothetical protein [Gemmataceae bacterium]